MKLSTAILKGSKGRKQTSGQLRDETGAVCALGAACYGVGFTPELYGAESVCLLKLFPYLGKLSDCISSRKTLADKIVDNNDNRGWGFKRIANWLKKLGY